MKKCAIMQPTYIPWLGYFDLIDQVDCFVFLDDVQLSRRSWQVRNKIKAGQELYLSVSIQKNKSRSHTTIQNAAISYDGNWRNKHLGSIYHSYKKSTFFDQVYPFVEKFLLQTPDYLAESNRGIITAIWNKIGYQKEFISSSDLPTSTVKKDNYLLSICRKVGADYYLSARGSSDYIEKEWPGGAFADSKVKLYYHNYDHPEYRQLGETFLSI